MEERLKLIEDNIQLILKELELLQKDIQFIGSIVKQEIPASTFLTNSFAVEVQKKIEEEVQKENGEDK